MENLITVSDISSTLQLRRNTVYALLPSLVADGLQEVAVVGSTSKRRFRRVSLDTIIKKAAETGRPIGALKRNKKN